MIEDCTHPSGRRARTAACPCVASDVATTPCQTPDVSYELVFWQQNASQTLDPESIYQELMDERGSVPGLNDIPVDAFLDALVASFPGASREANGPGEWLTWVSPTQRAGLEVTWSRHHLRADCRGMSGDDMHRIVNVAIGLGCPLYDPQVGERFAFDGH